MNYNVFKKKLYFILQQNNLHLCHRNEFRNYTMGDETILQSWFFTNYYQ